MRVGGAVLPLLVAARGEPGKSGVISDEFLNGLAVVYSFGPPYGDRLLTTGDLERLRVTRREIFRLAARNLRAALEDAAVHGRLPTLMLSFAGLESSALLDADFWERLSDTVPGELVVGVPARDVVVITGSGVPQGLERARRAVDRVFFAGGQQLLTRDLLVWRRRAWEVLRPALSTQGRHRS